MNTNHQPVIEINELEYSYGSTKVLEKLNLNLESGSVMGLLGENGAGKTTLMNCLLGFLKPQNGSSKIFGEDSRHLSTDARQRLAFVPQTNDLYPWMKAKDVINFTSKFYACWNHKLVDRLISEWKIPLDRTVEKMSVGEAQKLSILLAMSHEPELLILDEPVASLDPAAKRVFIKQLIELTSEHGNSILFSTHITTDIERVAAQVAIIKSGKTWYQGEIDTLKERVTRIHILANDSLTKTPLANLNNIAGIMASDIDNNQAVLTLNNYSDSLKAQIEQQYDAKVTVQTMNLEDIFVAVAAAA